MKNLWNLAQAAAFDDDPLAMRVYSSRLLGREPSLVLHGGGNTSVKTVTRDLLGNEQEVLFVKGSGWDLASIEKPGFAAVKMDTLLALAALDSLTDRDMVRIQRSAMLDPSAPNPSVEAILHAIIPFAYVDHTHADAVITLTNTPSGEELIRSVYGSRLLVIPYVMPGFILARKVWQMTRNIDWAQYDGMVLMNHGLFTFANNAQSSYDATIKLVTEAELFLQQRGALQAATASPRGKFRRTRLAELRKQVSQSKGRAVLALFDSSPQAAGFASLQNMSDIASRGPLTPDHVIRTKQRPLIVRTQDSSAVEDYADSYRAYFDTFKQAAETTAPANKLTCLDPAPCWAVVEHEGLLAFGSTLKDARIIADISRHTIRAIQSAEVLGGWQALPDQDIFDMEYWELEQAKLGKGGDVPVLQGKVALVSGAANGIGAACVEHLLAQGACVAGLDIDPAIRTRFSSDAFLAFECDVLDDEQLRYAVEHTIDNFGGLDILVNNAGAFPPSQALADIDPQQWNQSLALNLSSQQRLMQLCLPFLRHGIDPSIIFVASKNVPAPGPGAGAYSVAKAGLTQLARVAALELGSQGIRVNVVHPNGVFDTALWDDALIAQRAAHYGMSAEQYRARNVLGTEVRSGDVAAIVCALASPLFAKTTGAQIPIDGGNERVI